MLPFHFRISIRKNSIKYFTVFEDFPFLLEAHSENTWRTKLQKSFERLVAEQGLNKCRPLTTKRLNTLINDLNHYMKGTGAIWALVKEESDFQEFQLCKIKIKAACIRHQQVINRQVLVDNQFAVPMETSNVIPNHSNNCTEPKYSMPKNPHKIRIICENSDSQIVGPPTPIQTNLFRPWQ